MVPSVTLGGWLFVPIIGLVLAAWGFFCLLYLIPRTQQNSNVRTDIFAVRACYWVIIAGLMCTTVWLLSAVLVRSLAILKATQILH